MMAVREYTITFILDQEGEVEIGNIKGKIVEDGNNFPEEKDRVAFRNLFDRNLFKAERAGYFEKKREYLMSFKESC